MIDQLLFLLYFSILLFVLYRIIKRKNLPINFWTTAGIFSFKILLGCLYGWIFLHYYHGDDTWNFFNDSLPETQKLIHRPAQFFLDFLPNETVRQANTWTQGFNFYLRDLEYWTIVKLIAIFNLLSRGNYYVDVVLFDFLICMGPLLLFRLMWTKYPDKKNWLILGIFFIPSIGFWISGIRGDGLLLFFMALIIYYTDKWLKEKKWRSLVWITFGFAGFLIFRLPYLAVFMLAYTSWIISVTYIKRSAIYYFSFIYLACLSVFFISLFISPSKNFTAPLIQKQHDFFQLHGNTRFELDSLKPDPTSFMEILPQAFTNTFIRPYLWEAKGALQWFSALDVVAAWVILVLVFIRPEKNWKNLARDPILLLFAFYGLSQIMMIGLIVPFPGAIVRYKVIPELYLIILASIVIQWNKKGINYNKK